MKCYAKHCLLRPTKRITWTRNHGIRTWVTACGFHAEMFRDIARILGVEVTVEDIRKDGK